jgi:predicted enzyme related to lactoylglutathione lyase
MQILVNIDVPDLARAEAFYTRAFDFVTGRRFGGLVVELNSSGSNASGTVIYLLQKDSGTAATRSADTTRTYARHWTPVHLDFIVANIESAIARAVSAGAILEDPIDTQPWGRIAHLADPFGHGVCLIQFTGRGYDEIADS